VRPRRRKARLERGRARGVVAAKAERHHADAPGVKLAAGSEILVSGGGIAFGLGDQRQIAEADALPVAGTVNDQATDAARGKVGNSVAVLQLFGDIETIEEHHARCAPR